MSWLRRRSSYPYPCWSISFAFGIRILKFNQMHFHVSIIVKECTIGSYVGLCVHIYHNEDRVEPQKCVVAIKHLLQMVSVNGMCFHFSIPLTHIGPMTPHSVSELGQDWLSNALSPDRCYAITWTNVDLVNADSGTSVREIRSKYIMCQEDAFETVACKMVDILSGLSVTWSWYVDVRKPSCMASKKWYIVSNV